MQIAFHKVVTFMAYLENLYVIPLSYPYLLPL
jgi:hypothetical protein